MSNQRGDVRLYEVLYYITFRHLITEFYYIKNLGYEVKKLCRKTEISFLFNENFVTKPINFHYINYFINAKEKTLTSLDQNFANAHTWS